MLYPFYQVANSDFLGGGGHCWFPKLWFHHFFVWLLFCSLLFHFCNAVSISSGVTSESYLILITPLEVFNFACEYARHLRWYFNFKFSEGFLCVFNFNFH